MSALDLEVVRWLGAPTDAEELTVGEFRISADGWRPFTEVQDLLALSTRDSIRVCALRVAEWLVSRWWRLCWEPVRTRPDRVWRYAHSMAGLGGGFAWPALEISGDGEFVQISMQRESDADASAIRYLNEVVGFEVPVETFQRAVERFCDEVEARIASVPSIENTLGGLREELREERDDAEVASRCRYEARAGYDPGDAPPNFHADVRELSREAGRTAVEDLLVVEHDFAALRLALESVKQAKTEVDLSGVPTAPVVVPGVKPWQRGVAAAREARKHLSIPDGPVTDEKLKTILGVRLPIDPDPSTPSAAVIAGGFRSHLGVTRAIVRNARVESQRFYFARLLGMAASMPRTEPFLPVADSATALQKFSRSFAQELLCPWRELAEWTDQNGTGEESIQRAAERYKVSEMLITTTLVNRGRLDRQRLVRFCA